MTDYDHNFKEACDFLFKLEGWEVTDTGGPTILGITQKWHPGYYARIQAAATKDEKMEIARECYFKEYWEPVALLTGYVPQNGKVEENPLVTFQKVSFIQFVNVHRDTITSIIKKAKEEITKKADCVLWKCLRKYHDLEKIEKYKPYFVGWVSRVLQIAERYHITGEKNE